MPPVARILDANANRAREALRVMEDAARFLLNDAQLSEASKRLRHDLATGLSRFDNLEFNRDTPGDVGTTIATESERSRASTHEVVIAAGKRLGEALRTLEEYGKTLDAGFAECVEKLRYRGYELEKMLHVRMGCERRAQWSVCVLLSESLCVAEGGWYETATAILDAEPDCLQLREKDLDDDEFLRRAILMVQYARGRTAIIINDRPDIALLAGADGVHLGQHDLPCEKVREMLGRSLIIGVSTSNLDEAQAAYEYGADYCGVGPMFPTTTKHKDMIVGPEYLREYVTWNRLPHLAIGGITPGNVGDLVAAGGRGIAVSSAVCRAADPGAVVKTFKDAINHTRVSS